MPHYRIYSTGADDHISAPPIVVECADDQEAIQKAQQAVNGKAVELWQGERLIVRFPTDEPKWARAGHWHRRLAGALAELPVGANR